MICDRSSFLANDKTLETAAAPAFDKSYSDNISACACQNFLKGACSTRVMLVAWDDIGSKLTMQISGSWGTKGMCELHEVLNKKSMRTHRSAGLHSSQHEYALRERNHGTNFGIDAPESWQVIHLEYFPEGQGTATYTTPPVYAIPDLRPDSISEQ